jgi:ABC-type phosphate transport system substrate-binding protein
MSSYSSDVRALSAALMITFALLAPSHRASAQGFVIVVNEAGPTSLTRDVVTRIFLKKSVQLTPVDQAKDAKVRAAFSKSVLGRPLSAVISYWQQQIFSGGNSPPVEKTSDSEVLAFVRSNPKAIGYVADGTDLGAGVRAVTVQ